MALATVSFHSQALGKIISYTVFTPVEPGPHPVLVQLHGFSDDHSTWVVRSKIARFAAGHRLIVVMPDGGTSFYLNLGRHRDYEDFLVRDLREHVEGTFRTRRGRWAIGGLSMGGYGAVRIGLKHPDLFASIWAHSGSYPTREELAAGRWPIDIPPDLDDADVYALRPRSGGPVLSLDCGVDDFLIEDNRRLHAHLERIGAAHQYVEHPGAHTWDYWDEHVREALEQHARVLRATKRV